MSEMFRKGSRVKWNWGQGICRGRIAERFESPIECIAEGGPMSRNGSARDPAYLIMTDRGAQVLKLASELSRA